MIAIVQACGTNFRSLECALNRLGYSSIITHDPAVIESATHVILPGVGHASRAMEQLKQHSIDQLIPKLKQPVLGICLGMQLFFEESEEGNVKCLNLLPGKIKKLPKVPSLSIPHMGWNQLHITGLEIPLLSGIPSNSYVYFVHSYYAEKGEYTLGLTTHGISFSSVIQYKNFYGMQFHPEKSAQAGAMLLKNFLNEKV